MRPADTWQEYELIDATNHNRLERWGDTLLIRPDPQIIWKNEPVSPLWNRADAIYHRSARGGGQWEQRRKLPARWQIAWQDLTLIVSPTGFKHTGVFPEQAVNWAWYREKIKAAGRPFGRGFGHPCGRLQGDGGLGAGKRCGVGPCRPPLPLDC